MLKQRPLVEEVLLCNAASSEGELCPLPCKYSLVVSLVPLQTIPLIMNQSYISKLPLRKHKLSISTTGH